jgi:hypothetical protein
LLFRARDADAYTVVGVGLGSWLAAWRCAKLSVELPEPPPSL